MYREIRVQPPSQAGQSASVSRGRPWSRLSPTQHSLARRSELKGRRDVIGWPTLKFKACCEHQDCCQIHTDAILCLADALPLMQCQFSFNTIRELLFFFFFIMSSWPTFKIKVSSCGQSWDIFLILNATF